ncbi:MAG: Lrp/AsnC family transcriptional regulator [Candidatus Hodarchaeales archaeon]|jgi:DNA-binding Lrp family transcriptional regulator
MVKETDDRDIKILRMLSKDGRQNYRDIANELNVSSQTVKDRMNKLVADGRIKRYTIEIDPTKIGYPIEFICELDIQARLMDDILKVLKTIKEIHIIKITTGIHDILCIGNASSIENLHNIVEKKISLIKGINKTYTSITMRRVKENQVINFNE